MALLKRNKKKEIEMNVIHKKNWNHSVVVTEHDGWFYVWCDGMEYDFFKSEVEAINYIDSYDL